MKVVEFMVNIEFIWSIKNIWIICVGIFFFVIEFRVFESWNNNSLLYIFVNMFII